MDDLVAPSPSPTLDTNGAIKRKRSPSAEHLAAPVTAPSTQPPAKAAKTGGSGHHHHLQINYLARHFLDVLPLINVDDGLPAILRLMTEYGGVLDRHESLAGNLGAKPLGPILVGRFERIFDGPPRVLKNSAPLARDGSHVQSSVTWLDVVEFARHKPEQFNLERMRDGVRVCQFYTKQCRVEISEDDFVLIQSGMPQKMIPPQPIAEDEEKELGTLEIMEKNIGQIIQLADQVSAKARQFRHRLSSRRNAIVNRREAEAASQAAAEPSRASIDPDPRASRSPTATGFTAVNSRAPGAIKDSAAATNGVGAGLSNGRSYTATTASPSTRAELLSYFASQRERPHAADTVDYLGAYGIGKSKMKHRPGTDSDYGTMLLHSASPGPNPGTPSNQKGSNGGQAASAADRFDDSGPYKAEMLARMEAMARGDRVMPPCDRCRRLHMDCSKNLTACLGCTKKHAKCSWKEVTEQELADNPPPPRANIPGKDAGSGPDAALRISAGSKAGGSAGGGTDDGYGSGAMALDGPPQPVRDEELLGEDSEDEAPPPPPPAAATSVGPASTNGAAPNGVAPAAVLNGGSEGPSPRLTPFAQGATPQPSTSGAPGVVSPARASSPTVEPKRSPAEVEASAREILRKRLGTDIHHNHANVGQQLFEAAAAAAGSASTSGSNGPSVRSTPEAAPPPPPPPVMVGIGLGDVSHPGV